MEVVEEDVNGLVQCVTAQVQQNMDLTSEYISKYGKSVSQLEKIAAILETTFNDKTRAAYMRRFRSVKTQSELLKNDCTVLSTASKLDTAALGIITELSNNGDDAKTFAAGCEIQTLSSTLRSALPSCSKTVKFLVEEDYMKCMACETMLRKELCFGFGAKLKVAYDESKLIEIHFICRGCGRQAIEELETLSSSTAEPPKKTSPQDVHSSSQKKKSKKKKKRKSRIRSPHASQGIAPFFLSTGSQDELVDDEIQEEEVFQKERKEKVPAKLKYPSNDRLVNTLAKNHSILALNDYLDECEGDEYEDVELTALEKWMLEEFRDECLVAARSQDITDKTKASATKGYLIAAQMVVALEMSEADVSEKDAP